MKQLFINAEQAFEYWYEHISLTGAIKSGTTLLKNVGFYIENPLDHEIKTKWRNWKKDYAEKEYQWYLSKNRSVEELSKDAKIWNNMHSGDFIVNSNYGWQWNRNNQLMKITQMLIDDKDTRKAFLTIYDGKEIDDFKHDTPCTLSIGFNIEGHYLNMNVMMRSNDLWFGFCNDQYCFSSLQRDLAVTLGLGVGWYYHHVNDFHIYDKQLGKSPKVNDIESSVKQMLK